MPCMRFYQVVRNKQPDNPRGVTSTVNHGEIRLKFSYVKVAGMPYQLLLKNGYITQIIFMIITRFTTKEALKITIFSKIKNAISRSSKLIEGMRESNLLDCKGNLLEIGPGEGNFLKEFSCAFPNWDLFANDFNDNAKDRISSEIKIKKFFSGDISNISTNLI